MALCSTTWLDPEGYWNHRNTLTSVSIFPLYLSFLFLPSSYRRKKHISTLLNVRGMIRQAERQEILNVVRDFESSNGSTLPSRDHALFSDIPVTSEVHCINLGLIRVAMTLANWFSEARLRRHRKRSPRNRTTLPPEHLKEDKDMDYDWLQGNHMELMHIKCLVEQRLAHL